MLNKYKNLLFNSILEKGLKVDDFIYADKNPAFSQIIYKNTPLYFNIFVHPSSHNHFKVEHITHSPMFNSTNLIPSDFRPNFILDSEVIHFENWNCMNFDTVLKCFNTWTDIEIKNYLNDLDIPDEWELYKNGNKILSIDEDINSDKFTEDQLKNVSVKLNEFKIFILNQYSPNSDQLNTIEEKINYLIDAANRNTIFDWRNITLSVLINIASTLMLDSEKAMQMFNFFKSLFITIIFLPT